MRRLRDRKLDGRERVSSLRRFGWIVFVAFASVWGANAADVNTNDLPKPYAGVVDYRKDILPIFENSCFRCHGPERPKSGLRLDNRASALQGGDEGPDIFPGNSADSPLIHYVARLVTDMEMPPTGKADPLKPYEIALLRAWIDQGVDYGGADQPERARLSLDLTTGAGYLSVSGDRARFREQTWMNDGWYGGVSKFSASGPIDERTDFKMDGRVLFERHDAEISFDVHRKEWGGIRGGVETRRQWFDDSGGYHTDFVPSQFATGDDPYLDFGRAWFDFYLERPNWPSVRLGYELQFREGTESSTRWGSVTSSSGTIRNVYPTFRDVDERTHIFKFDIGKEFGSWRLDDSLRVEWHDQDNRLQAVTAYDPAGSGSEKKYTDVHEGYQHTQGANSLTVEKNVQEWLGFTAGYLYSWLDGSATFDQTSFLTDTVGSSSVIGFTPDDRFFHANRIVLNRRDNVASFGARVGPWQELVLYGGVQADWSQQHGFSDVTQRFNSPTNAVHSAVLSWSDIDRQLTEERAGVRFTGLPFTSIYAEGLWQQESVDQFEDQSATISIPNISDIHVTPIDRGTDAEARVDRYRVGFNTSPWRSLKLAAHYQLSDRRTGYSPTPDDQSNGPAGNGYPNFITGRRIDSDEAETSLTARLGAQLKARVKFQWDRSDYETRHQALSAGTPGGAIDAGNEDAQIYSAGLYWTPLTHLGLDVSGSYADTRLTTFANNSPSVVPYDGQVWSVTTSANWTVNERTRLGVAHVWSMADYRQSNFAAGLPLGIVYQWHQIRANVERQLTDQLSVNLLYLCQLYEEPSAGTFNDYTAHGIFVSFTWHWDQ